jgi:NAD+ synthase (glutamine-hydrolysing)
MRGMRVGMAQINSIVGDFTGNTEKIIDTIDTARTMGVDLLAFPELAICGYPPEDLLFKPKFLDENRLSLERIVAASSGIAVVVGFVDAKDDVYNAAATIYDGKLVDVYHKVFLPNYGVCDEDRYFRRGQQCPVYIINGIGVGVSVCEDIWYEAGPVTVQALSGAEVLVNISASPYHVGRPYHRGRRYLRESMVESRAADNVAIVIYTNLVGGQDELVFDGNSIIVDETGMLLGRGKQFEEDLIVVDLDIDAVFRARLQDPRWRKMPLVMGGENWQVTEIVISGETGIVKKPPIEPRKIKKYSILEEIYGALLLGTRDYVRKNGFEKVVIGLSGGVDSSLVAAIAADALGPSNVVGVYMPSNDSSPESLSITKLLAEKLGIDLITIPVGNIYQSYLNELVDTFKTTEVNIAEENIKNRIRGNILMALSNKFNWLVLSASNKSELATGYSTSYGDIAGGFAVIKDVYKLMVYKLAKYRNSIAGSDLLPAAITDKTRLAELKPHQWYTGNLPPFDLLDWVLTAYIEEDKNVDQIVAMGIDEKIVRQIALLVDTSEYKRRQAPPGIKITPRAFGRDRRLPITNKFRES